MTNLFLVLQTEEKTNKQKKMVNKNQNYNNSQRKIVKRCWKLKRPTIQIGRTVLLHYIMLLSYEGSPNSRLSSGKVKPLSFVLFGSIETILHLFLILFFVYIWETDNKVYFPPLVSILLTQD